MRGDGAADGVVVGPLGESNFDVEVFEEEVRIDVGGDSGVGTEDGLKFDVDKVVERVDMLLDESFDGEESGQQIPFILRISVGSVRFRLCDDRSDVTDRVGGGRRLTWTFLMESVKPFPLKIDSSIPSIPPPSPFPMSATFWSPVIVSC